MLFLAQLSCLEIIHIQLQLAWLQNRLSKHSEPFSKGIAMQYSQPFHLLQRHKCGSDVHYFHCLAVQIKNEL